MNRPRGLARSGWLLAWLLVLLSPLCSSAQSGRARPHTAAQWQQVAALRQQKKFNAAYALVNRLRQQAHRQQQPLEYLRALLDNQSFAWLNDGLGFFQEAEITQLEGEVRTLAFPAQAIVHSILGQRYAEFLSRQQYRASLGGKGNHTLPGLEGWSDTQLVSAALRHYRQSVQIEPARQLQLSLRSLPPQMVTLAGTAAERATQPSLHDLLVHRAAEGLVHLRIRDTPPPQPQFKLRDPAVLDSLPAYVRLPLAAPTPDSPSVVLEVLQLWQNYSVALLRSPHATKSQLAAAELHRILFVQKQGAFPKLDSLVTTALLRGARRYAALPTSAEFLVAAARTVMSQDKGRALAYCREAERRFPASPGGRQAKVLRQLLLGQASLFVQVPGTQPPHQPWQARVTAARVRTLFGKAYRMPGPPTEKEPVGYERVNEYEKARQEKARRQPPVAAWSLPLTACPDSTCQNQQLVSCPGLPPGRYLLVFSTTDTPQQWQAPGQLTCEVEMGISSVAVHVRPDYLGRPPALLLLDRNRNRFSPALRWRPLYLAAEASGGRKKEYLGPEIAADSTGWQRVPEVSPTYPNGTNAELVGLVAYQKGDSLRVLRSLLPTPSLAPPPEVRPERAATFYTNQAVYEPGQTLRYQVLLTSLRLATPRQALAGRADTVILSDDDGQVLARQPFVSSEFGSFAGQIVLADSLAPNPERPVRLRLRTSQGAADTSPSLQVQRPAVPPSLQLTGPGPLLQPNQVVRVQGQLRQPPRSKTPFRVSYWVGRRLVQLDSLLTGQWYNAAGNPPELVTQGETELAPDGSFALSFVAAAPSSPHPEGRLGYQYCVLAALATDSGAAPVPGQYHAYVNVLPQQLSLSGPERIDREQPAPFTLAATGPLGTGVPTRARGWLQLYRLQPPAGTSPTQYVPFMTHEERMVSGEASSGLGSWPRKLQAAWAFDTGTGSPLSWPAGLRHMEPGVYVLVATTDTLGYAIGAQAGFVLYSATSEELPYPSPHWFVAPAARAAAGQRARVLLGCATGGRVLLELGIGDSTISQHWQSLAPGRQHRWDIPLEPRWEGRQVWLRATHRQHHQLLTQSATILVTTDPESLSLRLRRGQLRVRDAQGLPAPAELLLFTTPPSLNASQANVSGMLAAPALPEITPRMPLVSEQSPPWTSSTQTSLPEQAYYWPQSRPAVLGRSLDGEDSVAVTQLNRLILGWAAEAPALPAALRNAFYAEPMPSIPTAEVAAGWQPMVRPDGRGQAGVKLPSPAGVTPRELLVQAYTADGRVGQLRQVVVPATPLQLQMRAVRQPTPQPRWQVTAEVRNDGLKTRRGHLRIAIPVLPGEKRLVDLGRKRRQSFSLLPGQRAQLTWTLTAAKEPLVAPSVRVTGKARAQPVQAVTILPALSKAQK